MFNFPYTNFHELNQDIFIKLLNQIKAIIPTKTSQLVNDSGFITEATAAPVQSVNGKTGNVVLDAADVGAKPASYVAPVTSVNNKIGDVVLSAADVGAMPSTYEAPVWSVNGETGNVVLDARDVSAMPVDTEEAKRLLTIPALNAVQGAFTVAAGATGTFTVANNSRGLLIVTSLDSDLVSMWYVYTNSIGTTRIFPAGTAPASLTAAATTNTVTFTNAATQYSAFVYAIMFTGTIS